MPITNEEQVLGFAILVHDLGYIDRREAQARTFVLIGSGLLAILAFGVPMGVARWARYNWSLELRAVSLLATLQSADIILLNGGT